MFGSYLKSALRNLAREKFYAALNIAGLSLGIACALILALYLKSELTYDRHFSNHERLYRVVNLLDNNGFVEDYSRTPPPTGPLLKANYPEVEDFVRFRKASSQAYFLRHEQTGYYWNRVFFADANVFELFNHPILAGDPATALKDNYAVAISRTAAMAYFGGTDVIGQTLSTDTSDYRVSLVFEDLPANTHLRYDLLFSYGRLYPNGMSEASLAEELGNTADYTYLLMPPDYDVADFATISDSFWETYYAAADRLENSHKTYYLEPLTAIHLRSTTLADLSRGNFVTVYAFIAIGIFVLMIACINYMNLATARYVKRAREVGMRKVLGAGRHQLIGQFLGESLVYTGIALIIAVVLAELVLSFTPLNSFLDKQISILEYATPPGITGVLLAALVLGLISGSYPAFYLSSMGPRQLFTDLRVPAGKGSLQRQGLVSVQFVISICVIASTLLMFSQLRFINEKPMGYEREHKLIFRLQNDDARNAMAVIRQRLLEHPGILGVTGSGSIPGSGMNITVPLTENNDGVETPQTFHWYQVDEYYLDVMGITLTRGVNFQMNSAAGETGLLVNETAVREMGWEQPLGKTVGGTPVIGVFADFHFQDLTRPVERLALLYGDSLPFVTINYQPEQLASVVQHLQSVWLEFDPVHPLSYQILDGVLAEQYASEQKHMSLVGIFSLICILISCLGLYGLTAFTVEKRSREIGIRKILGASLTQILVLLYENIVYVVMGASVAASLASYWAVTRWLQGFAYRTDIDYLAFVLAAGVSLLVAVATMSLQAIQINSANPADVLRHE